jgi:hypothetical protein
MKPTWERRGVYQALYWNFGNHNPIPARDHLTANACVLCDLHRDSLMIWRRSEETGWKELHKEQARLDEVLSWTWDELEAFALTHIVTHELLGETK